MTLFTRRPLLAAPALVGWALAGCATPPPPAVLTLDLAGGADQNPDPSGRASPVAVQLFYLSATAKFERADVFALTEREAATLGQDSAGSEQFVLAPNEKRTLTRQLKPGVQALGVVALFRDVDSGATWRAVVPVATSGPTKVVLKTAKSAVAATVAS